MARVQVYKGECSECGTEHWLVVTTGSPARIDMDYPITLTCEAEPGAVSGICGEYVYLAHTGEVGVDG